jgi:hypothetical protein
MVTTVRTYLIAATGQTRSFGLTARNPGSIGRSTEAAQQTLG